MPPEARHLPIVPLLPAKGAVTACYWEVFRRAVAIRTSMHWAFGPCLASILGAILGSRPSGSESGPPDPDRDLGSKIQNPGTQFRHLRGPHFGTLFGTPLAQPLVGMVPGALLRPLIPSL